MDPGVAPWYAELASTDGLDVCKGGVLFVVLVVEDRVRVRVFESLADFADFSKMVVDIVLGVAVPCHEASNLASKKDSLHALVLERERLEKGFTYLLKAQKLCRAVFVTNGVGVEELGPQRCKAAIYGVFKKIAFIFVHRHP